MADCIGQRAVAARMYAHRLAEQLAVAADSNEIPVVPALLELLAPDGAVVTADAPHTQRATAQTIRDRGADDVLPRKDNQSATHDTVATFFNDTIRAQWRGAPHQTLVTEDDGHGRLAVRRYWTSADPRLLAYLASGAQCWPDICSAGMVMRERTTDGRTSRKTRYYLSIMDGDVATLAASVRAHRGSITVNTGSWT